MKPSALSYQIAVFFLTSFHVLTPTVVSAQGKPVHRVVTIEGMAEYRVGAGILNRLSEGLEVGHGFLIRVGKNSEVHIVCTHGQIRVHREGEHLVDCPDDTPIMRAVAMDRRTLRTVPSDSPIIHSPRRTAVRELRPNLRWLPPVDVATDAKYIVRMHRGAEVIWEFETAKTALPYPKGLPALEREAVYRLEVVLNGRSSNEEKGFGYGFRVASEADIALVEERLSHFEGMPSASRELLLAQVLASADVHDLGFFAEAIAMIEDNTQPAAQELLGNLYHATALASACQAAWQIAVSSYEAAGDRRSAMRIVEQKTNCE